MRAWIAAAVTLAAGLAPLQASPAPSLSARVEGRNLSVGWTSAPKSATEWEAFLSFDGGTTLSLRVTPHLPISTRDFVFELPRLAESQAMVVFRFGDGDEDREREFHLSAPIRLEPNPMSRLLRARAGDLGKRPASGEESSVGWAESADVTVVPPAESGVEPESRLVAPRSQLSFTRSSWSSAPEDGAGQLAPLAPARCARQRRPAAAPDVLLLTSRLNV